MCLRSLVVGLVMSSRLSFAMDLLVISLIWSTTSMIFTKALDGFGIWLGGGVPGWSSVDCATMWDDLGNIS